MHRTPKPRTQSLEKGGIIDRAVSSQSGHLDRIFESPLALVYLFKMSDHDALYQNGLYLSPEQQGLLYAALSSSNHFSKGQQGDNATINPLNARLHPQQDQQQSQRQAKQGSTSSGHEVFDSPTENGLNSSRLGFDESPFLDFDIDADFDLNASAALIGDLPGEPESQKRKSIDGKQNEESGKKRKENEEKVPKKPGRKPLTSEPTSKRKAQNRAAQRAFRERKEKHLKDLETKVEELERASQATTTENSVLRAQVERLQIELKEYRKRLSWISTGNSIGAASNLYSGANNIRNYPSLNNEFTFHFPKFGDVPNSQFFDNKQRPSASLSSSNRAGSLPGGFTTTAGQLTTSVQRSPHSHASISSISSTTAKAHAGTNSPQIVYNKYNGGENSNNGNYSFQNVATFSTNSPCSSSESNNGHISSLATSPEPMVNSPSSGKNSVKASFKNGEKVSDSPLAQSNGQSQTSPQKAETNDIPGFDWLAQQNGGQFDPVLFNDYRDPQDAVLTQDFPDFFDDAFPFGGSSFNNFALEDTAPKSNLIGQIDSALAADDEVVPGEDKSQMLTCTSIWDRLQKMDRFRNGEIDVDNLCSELRTKARCSEGGVVVDKNDVEDIVTRAK